MSDPYGKKSVPTKPMMPRVQEPGDDEGEPTHQRCPLCLGVGTLPPDLAIAFEAYCTRLRQDQK